MNNLNPFEQSVYKMARYHHYLTMYVLGGVATGIALNQKVGVWTSLTIGIGTAVIVGQFDPSGFKKLKESVA